MEDDHDLQVFLGIFICLGFAAVATAIGLPAALGSFAAGVYLGRIRAFRWLDQALRPFQVFFVALFFVSIGLRFDARYMGDHWPIVLLFSLGALLINGVISALCFRLMGHRWSISLQAGALLSQTGEFGLVASAIALKAGIIPGDLYKLCVAVTGLALLLSTAWITILRRMITIRKNRKKTTVKYENEILH